MDFGITLRPKQKLDVDKTINKLTITLANGQNLIFGDPYKDNLNYVKALGTSGKNRLVLAEIDNELIQGATVEVEYAITITNYSEIDYDYRENTNYYYWGSKEGGQILDNVIFKLVDYMSGGLVLDKQKSLENDVKWNELSADNLLSLYDQRAYIDKNSVYENLENQGKGYTILETNDIGKIKPPTEYNQPGGTTIVKLYASKLLAVNETGVVLDNHAEIIET